VLFTLVPTKKAVLKVALLVAVSVQEPRTTAVFSRPELQAHSELGTGNVFGEGKHSLLLCLALNVVTETVF